MEGREREKRRRVARGEEKTRTTTTSGVCVKRVEENSEFLTLSLIDLSLQNKNGTHSQDDEFK